MRDEQKAWNAIEKLAMLRTACIRMDLAISGWMGKAPPETTEDDNKLHYAMLCLIDIQSECHFLQDLNPFGDDEGLPPPPPNPCTYGDDKQ